MVRIVLFPRVKPFFCRANKYMSEKKCLFDYLFKNGCNKILLLQSKKFSNSLTAARLAPSVERLTAEREVAGSILGAGPILKFLKQLRNEGTPFALQAARPSCD